MAVFIKTNETMRQLQLKTVVVFIFQDFLSPVQFGMHIGFDEPY